MYATPGAACCDLFALEGAVVYAGDAVTLRTGLAVNLPDGLTMLVHSRSGHGFKHGLRLGNSTGIVDSDYKGEIMVRLHNDGNTGYSVKAGERIAQAMFVETMQYPIVEVQDVGTSERGEGGIGSTGK
ncbi:Deoxyuridine 5'-triphosphate nucleotidohydrolase [compost metagenome]